MFQNRTAQLIYQSFFCAFGLIGIAASLGFFDMEWRWDFYIHFTNLSNYLCIGIMFAELIQTARKKRNSYVKTAPLLKFIGMLGILLTFLVFNLLLANEPTRDPALNYKVSSILFHIVLPILYIADWFLFYERRKVRWTYPLIGTLFPVLYVIFVFIHAWALKFDASIPNFTGTGSFIYPYFFLNLETLGIGGVLKWSLILSAGFVLAGFLFFGLDKILPHRKKKA